MHSELSMTHQELPVTNRGFTLIETIIYVALFALLFSGMLASIWPFLQGAESISTKVVVESEATFAIQKINALLASSTAFITTPSAGTSGNILTLTAYTGDTYTVSTSSTTFMVQKNAGTAVPFTAERLSVSNFSVRHVAPSGGFPRFIEYSFTASSVVYGPIRKYFTF